MSIDECITLLKQESSFILAIDGMCAAGKSTLASYLQEQLDAQVFHMDDFFLPAELRTPERFIEPGGNVHYERFLETVLKPLSKHQTVHYQRFDCHQMAYQPVIDRLYHSRNIVEGTYALHPQLLPYYSHVVVLKIDSQLQIERLSKRNFKQIKQFQERWIPLENQYFEYYHLFEKYPVIKDIHIL